MEQASRDLRSDVMLLKKTNEEGPSSWTRYHGACDDEEDDDGKPSGDAAKNEGSLKEEATMQVSHQLIFL